MVADQQGIPNQMDSDRQGEERRYSYVAIPDLPPDAFVYTLHRLAAVLQHDTVEALYMRAQSAQVPFGDSAGVNKSALLLHWVGCYVRRWTRILTLRLHRLSVLEALMRQTGTNTPEDFAASLAMDLEVTLQKLGVKGQAVVRFVNTGLDHFQREWCPTVWKVDGLPLQIIAKALWYGLTTDLVSYRRDFPGATGPPAYPLMHRDLRLSTQHPVHGNLWDEDEVHDLLIAVIFYNFYQLPVQAADDAPVLPLPAMQMPYNPPTSGPPHRPRYLFPGVNFYEAGVGPMAAESSAIFQEHSSVLQEPEALDPLIIDEEIPASAFLMEDAPDPFGI